MRAVVRFACCSELQRPHPTLRLAAERRDGCRLPQLCLPQGTDQPSNTAALVPTGAGLARQPEELTADAVAEALGPLLHEPSFRQAAGRLQAEIERMPTPPVVLDDLLADLGR